MAHLTGPSLAPPIAKFPPGAAMNPLQPSPATMSFDTFDGSEYSAPPMLDQFPDYDWAASFDFSNEWPTVPMAPLPEGTPFNFG